jgi:hypothetical protein
VVHLSRCCKTFFVLVKAGTWPYNSKNIIGFISSTYEELEVGTKRCSSVAAKVAEPHGHHSVSDQNT